MEKEILTVPPGKCWDCKINDRESSPRSIYCEQCRKKEGESFLLKLMKRQEHE
jgi:hypothetical protein